MQVADSRLAVELQVAALLISPDVVPLEHADMLRAYLLLGIDRK
jgi:hypothetical protein